MQSSEPQTTKFTTPLKVVPPQRQAPAPAAPPQDAPKGPMPSTLDPNSEDPFGWVKQSLKVGAVCVAVGAISFIPVPNNVNVGGGLEPQPHKLTPVYMKVPGTITQFLVEAGKPIHPNQAIAYVDTLDLDQEIRSKEQRLEGEKRQEAQMKQRLPIIQSRFVEKQLATQNSQVQTDLLVQRATGEPPEIIAVKQKKNIIEQQIKGLKGDLTSLHGQYEIIQRRLKRYQEGGAELLEILPLNVIENEQIQATNLDGLIKRKASDIVELQQQLFVKDIEIEALRKNWRDEAAVNAGRTKQTQVDETIVIGEFNVTQAELFHVQQLILALETELTELRQKREETRTLTTDQGGLVLTDNLNEKRGRKMQPHEPILEVADINILDVVMEVPQVDAPVVKKDGLIKVRFRDAGHGVHTSRIHDIRITFQSDKAEQKQLLIARASLENPNQTFRPHQEVSVEIIGEKIPLYKKVGLEIRKHINWGKYGMGE